MAVRLSKTSKIIFAISIVVLSIALGFLIYTVNQQDSLAPDDSQAGGGVGACCIPNVGCVSGWKCDLNKICTESEPAYEGAPTKCGTYNGKTVGCRTGFKCTGSGPYTCVVDGSIELGTCVRETDPSGPSEGECKDTKCEWPEVTMSGRPDASVPVCRCEVCTGKVPGQAWTCSGNPPTCNPGGCPTGYEACGDSTNPGTDPGCEKVSSISCTVYHPDCNNPSIIYRYCKKIPDEKIREDWCDNTWINSSETLKNITLLPSQSATITSRTKGTLVDYIYVALYNKDNKYANGTPKPICVPGSGWSGDCPSGTKHLTLSDSNRTLRTTGTIPVGTGDIFVTDMMTGWEGKKVERVQASGYFMRGSDPVSLPNSECVVSFSLGTVVLTNPEFEVSKMVVEKCIDEETPNPKAELTYTVRVSNKGTAAGTISKIEDVLDTKVQDSFVQTSTITSPGSYSSGKILWSFATPLSLDAGVSKEYTYKVIVDKDNFGKYSNTVTLTPSTGSTLSDTASITADCIITEEEQEEEQEIPVDPVGEVPQTAIFDSTASRIAVGVFLLVFGVFVYNAPNGVFTIHRREPSYKYRDRFEKKVANR